MSNSPMRLWDDNPTITDLLGIDTVVDAVVSALQSPALDPVTISIQSPWGGGKSSALQMIEERFEGDASVLVLHADPWEFEDVDDVRGTLISQILTELRRQRPESFRNKVGDLLTRIAWKRVATTVATSALTMSLKPDDLIKAFTPQENEPPPNMAGFREEFEKVMASVEDVTRVIVLVDDLDRCKPSSVVATLEAIKVFLSVPKMAFVLAAEEEMIRWSIAQDTHAGGRSEFADRYLEKIVQLPVTLPRLTRDGAETYVALLLSKKRSESNPDAFQGLVEHVAARRTARTFPILGGEYAQNVCVPDAADLRMAALVARGLNADKWSSPRAIKRFLNAWGVREAIATSRGLQIEPDVSLKFYILEQRFPKDFEALQEVPDAERADFVRKWEAWARGDEGSSQPSSVSESTSDWAASEPSLVAAMAQFDRYANLAASFTSVSAGSGLSDAELTVLTDLGSESDVIRQEAVRRVIALEPNVRTTLLGKSLTRLPSSNQPGRVVMSLCEIVETDPSLADEFIGGIRSYGIHHLEMGDVIEIANRVPGTKTVALMDDVSKDERIMPIIQNAAREQHERLAKQ